MLRYRCLIGGRALVAMVLITLLPLGAARGQQGEEAVPGEGVTDTVPGESTPSLETSPRAGTPAAEASPGVSEQVTVPIHELNDSEVMGEATLTAQDSQTRPGWSSVSTAFRLSSRHP
jgi:hypothetical protein